MTELPKGLQHFITRDINYLIGGGIVVASYLYLFGRLGANELPVVAYLLAGGVAYVIGYVLQDLFSVLRFVTTAPAPNPHPVVKWCYRRFTNETWKDLTGVDWSKANVAVKTVNKTEQERAEYERIVSLKMMGTTMSPCCLVSATLLGVRYWAVSRDVFDLSTAICALVLSAAFLILAWVKTSQSTQVDADAVGWYEKSVERGS